MNPTHPDASRRSALAQRRFPERDHPPGFADRGASGEIDVRQGTRSREGPHTRRVREMRRQQFALDRRDDVVVGAVEQIDGRGRRRRPIGRQRRILAELGR